MAIKFVLKQKNSHSQTVPDSSIAEFIFNHELFSIGSDAGSNLVLAKAAPEQAVIVAESDFLTLLNRADGTMLNNAMLTREAMQPLSIGDCIGIGDYLIFVVDEQNSTAGNNKPAAPRPVLSGDNKTEAEPQPKATRMIVADDAIAPPPAGKRNFAELLDTLRTEEDSFYFTIQNQTDNEIGRIPLQLAEMLLGANSNHEITIDAGQIATVFCTINKDWSGILLKPDSRAQIFVNDEPLAEPRRLRNDDRIAFAPPIKTKLVLHEPSSLIALETLLAARNSNIGDGNNPMTDNGRFGIQKTAEATGGAITGAETAALIAGENPKKTAPAKKYFGYFSFAEILLMLVGTIVLAVLWFLFFEFILF